MTFFMAPQGRVKRSVRQPGQRNKKRQYPETKLHIEIADYLRWAVRLEDGVWWSTIGHGGYKLPKRIAGELKRKGMKSGVPDMLILFRGKAIFWELKAGKNDLSDDQREVSRAIVLTGNVFFTIRSLDEAKASLEVLGIPLHAKLSHEQFAQAALRLSPAERASGIKGTADRATRETLA